MKENEIMLLLIKQGEMLKNITDNIATKEDLKKINQIFDKLVKLYEK